MDVYQILSGALILAGVISALLKRETLTGVFVAGSLAALAIRNLFTPGYQAAGIIMLAIMIFFLTPRGKKLRSNSGD